MANKIYHATETAVIFAESGGTVSFTPKNISSGVGRISAQWDRGSGSKPRRYKWYAKTKAAAALSVTSAKSLEIYLATARDGANTVVSGNQGTTDAAFASGDKRNNLQRVGFVLADSTSNGEVQIGSGEVLISDRYISVVWWNNFGQALTNTAGDHEFVLVPIPDEIQ